MRKLFLNFYVFVFLFVSDYAMFAQGPGTGSGGSGSDTGSGPGGAEDSGDPVASINTKLILLAVAAIGYAYYYFSKRREANVTSN